MIIASTKIGISGISILAKDSDSGKGYCYTVTGIMGLFFGLAGFLACVGDAVTHLCAPRAMAIQRLIEQLSMFGGG